jgi:hypothetical protein
MAAADTRTLPAPTVLLVSVYRFKECMHKGPTWLRLRTYVLASFSQAASCLWHVARWAGLQGQGRGPPALHDNC